MLLNKWTQPVENTPEPPWVWPRSAYIHIPFCAHKCGYCDFAIAVGHDDRIDLYLQALQTEMQRLGSPQAVGTIYFGGGTPSHLTPQQLERLFEMVYRWLILVAPGEVTFEANPDDVSEEQARLLGQLGVNRLSLGAQSFKPQLLGALDRRHRSSEVAAAADRVRRHVGQLSLDLIFAIPGQTLDDWRADVEQALRLSPDHLSTYGLTFEKGTPLWKLRESGQVESQSEESELAMFLAGKDLLEGAGFEHYEVSNFARPGRRSRHNQTYWANEAYFGFGMGAASYVRGVRRTNSRDLATYMRRALQGESTAFQEECLPPRQRALETVATQLRRRDGIARARFQLQTGFVLDDLLAEVLPTLIGWGHLEDDGHHVRLTRRGLCLADGVIREIFKACGAECPAMSPCVNQQQEEKE